MKHIVLLSLYVVLRAVVANDDDSATLESYCGDSFDPQCGLFPGICQTMGTCYIYKGDNCVRSDATYMYWTEKRYGDNDRDRRYLFSIYMESEEGCADQDTCVVGIEGEPCLSCEVCGPGMIRPDCSNHDDYIVPGDACLKIGGVGLTPNPDLGKACKDDSQRCKRTAHCCEGLECDEATGTCQTL